MNQLWSVIRFEFAGFAKSKSFVGITLFLMLVSVLGPAVPAIINRVGDITRERTIAIVDNTGWFTPDVFEEFIAPRAVIFPNIDAARAAVEDGEHNYALELTDGGFTLHVTAMGMGVANMQHHVAEMMRYRHRVLELGDYGVAHVNVRDILLFHPEMDVVTIGELAADADVFFENFIYAYVMVFVLYLGLLMGGNHLLTTVVREKSTKTMELLVTSCPSGKMLYGKVIGVGAAIMSQILLMVISAYVGMRITPLFTEGMDVFTVTLRPELLVYLVVFFLLGFVMYSFIYAALASTTSRMEDAVSMSVLPQMLIMVAFFASMAATQNPGADWIAAISHVPLFGPFVMFVRICMGTAPDWEIWVSIAAQVVSIGVIAWLAGKIYRMGTLMYGAKPTFKSLLAAFRD